jgi:hypothetical protein
MFDRTSASRDSIHVCGCDRRIETNALKAEERRAMDVVAAARTGDSKNQNEKSQRN